MRRREFAPCLLAMGAPAWLLAPAHAAVTVGRTAPDFELNDTQGKPVRLSDFKGKHVVLEWTNPGCPFVRKHYDSGNMPALHREFTAQGVVWLTINSTEDASVDYMTPPQLSRWMGERKAAPTAHLMDEDGVVGRAYGARVTPHMYIINPQGQLAYAGAIDSIASARQSDIAKATNYVRQGLSESLAGKPLSVSQNQAYGCTIKYGKTPA